MTASKTQGAQPWGQATSGGLTIGELIVVELAS
jgi:hypothetical protein